MIDQSISKYVPYSAVLEPSIVGMKDGGLMGVFEITGLAVSAMTDEELDSYKAAFNNSLKTLGRSGLSVWTTAINSPVVNGWPAGEFSGDFSSKLNDDLKARAGGLHYLRLYFTFIQHSGDLAEFKETLIIAGKLFKPYGARLLGELPGGFSEPLSFLFEVVNGFESKIKVRGDDIPSFISSTRWSLYRNTAIKEGVNGRDYIASVGIGGYPDETWAGMLGCVFACEFPFVLTQSFSFLSKEKTRSQLIRVQKRMLAADDGAISQMLGMTAAIDDLSGGDSVWGDYSFSLTTSAESKGAVDSQVSKLAACLSDAGIIPLREDFALMGAMLQAMPGAVNYRPRVKKISSDNFAGLNSMWGIPKGRNEGNAWGSAITMLPTRDGTPYYVNYHDSHSDSDTPLGNALVIGPSESGKTMLLGLLIAQSRKFGCTQIVFDKDRGLEILIRALGGDYSTLKIGEETGFCPFLSGDSPDNRLFLVDLIKAIVGGDLLHADIVNIRLAVDGVYGLPADQRRFRQLLQFFNRADGGLYDRLVPWVQGGEFAWIFDGEDSMPLFGREVVGFDVTEFLDRPGIRTPIIMFIFNELKRLFDGRKVQVYLDEFWRLLEDEYFEAFSKDALKVIRKKHGSFIFATQSPSDVIKSGISASLIEQCATGFYFANPKGRKIDYVDGFSLSESEFELVKSGMPVGAREVLIKQGRDSVVASVDVSGMNQAIKVISGTAASVASLEAIMEEVGNNPADFLPLFLEEVK